VIDLIDLIDHEEGKRRTDGSRMPHDWSLICTQAQMNYDLKLAKAAVAGEVRM